MEFTALCLSLLALASAFFFGRVFISDNYSTCGTKLASAHSVLLTVTLPMMLGTVILLFFAKASRLFSWTPFVIAFVAELLSLSVPYLWEMRADWW